MNLCNAICKPTKAFCAVAGAAVCNFNQSELHANISVCLPSPSLSLPVSLSLCISICILPINFVAVVASPYGRACFGDFMSS